MKLIIKVMPNYRREIRFWIFDRLCTLADIARAKHLPWASELDRLLARLWYAGWEKDYEADD